MAISQQTHPRGPSDIVRAPRRAGIGAAFSHYVAAVRADFELMRRGRAKYLGDDIGARAFPAEVVKRIGLQLMVAVRTMHLLRDAGLTPGAQIASRLIRHVYGAEIHWESEWEPGINLVHVPFRGSGPMLTEIIAGRVDLAVHSAKDLPSELPPDMALAACPPRADPRDALLSAEGRRLD